MKALDLFCGAGGVSMGLHLAGYKVVGVDLKISPRYPFSLVKSDALQPPFNLMDFDLIWASPPCQAHSAMRTMPRAKFHPDLIPATRELLQASGRKYVIENVPGADTLRPNLMLCGTMFGLGTPDGELRRHRWFETNFSVPLTPPCRHGMKKKTVGVYGHAGGKSSRDGTPRSTTRERAVAMGINWMTGDELSQAIPPLYSYFIGAAALIN